MEIMVDKQSLDASLSRLQGAIAAKIKVTGLNVIDCIVVEAGRLCEYMIDRCPGGEDTKRRIDARVKYVFASLGENTMAKGGHMNTSSSEIQWYAFNPTGIYGVAKDYDLTKANVDGLAAVFKQTKLKSGRIVAGQRGKQTIYLWQRYFTKQSTVNALAARLKKRVGLMKASFLPALREMMLMGFKSSRSIRADALRNEAGAKGSVENNLSGLDPMVDIISNANGISFKKAQRVASEAMYQRANAITSRLAILQAHPELLGQEMLQ